MQVAQPSVNVRYAFDARGYSVFLFCITSCLSYYLSIQTFTLDKNKRRFVPVSNISTKPIYLYNTLTRSKGLFQPLNPPRVGIYSCGPTVYKDIHVGAFRTFMMTDWLRRVLEYNGYDVYLVRNITDVGHLQNDTEESGEDKLENEARTTGRTAYDIAADYTKKYLHDEAELNILPPHLNPKATEHILEMQAMTQQLIENGLAYVT